MKLLEALSKSNFIKDKLTGECFHVKEIRMDYNEKSKSYGYQFTYNEFINNDRFEPVKEKIKVYPALFKGNFGEYFIIGDYTKERAIKIAFDSGIEFVRLIKEIPELIKEVEV